VLSVQLKHYARVLCLGSFVLSLGLGRAARGAAEPPASLGLDYSLTVFSQESGLAEHALASVAAASDGRLYYSTFSSLGRFDGNRCENLSAEAPPLAGVRTRKLFVDQRGRLWVGADGRILCQETNGWRSFGGAEGVPPVTIREFAETPSGVVWAASASNIVRLAGDRFESMPTPPGLNEERCFLAADQDGALWCAAPLCLSRFAAGRWETMLELPPSGTNRFMGLLAARSGGLWVAFERELKLWQGGVWTKVWRRPGGLIGDVVQMLEDARGHLWVGGWRSGLVAYRPDGQARQATTRDGLANDSVSDLAEDREGNIWLSSNGGGLVRLRPLAFRRYGQEAGLAQIANSIAEEAPGRMLIGTHGDGMARWEAGRISGLTFWPETNFLSGADQNERGLLDQKENHCWIKTRIPPGLGFWLGRGGPHQLAWPLARRRIRLCGSAP
jgi:ligand-binding sensor domain-containing protein